MSEVIGVPADALPSIWGLIAPFVVQCHKKANEHRLDVDDVYAMLLERDLQLWVVEEAGTIRTVVLTQILMYPKAKECDIFMASGAYPDDWQLVTDYLLTWAKSMGCTHASANMRRGLLKRMGWDERQTYCVRALT